MTEELISFRAEKLTTDALLRELKDRVESAEMECKINDEIDLKTLDFNDVQIELKLKRQIVKQRHEIVQKEKLTLAGWDLAAEATEKMEKCVDKAYRRGKEEMINERAGDVEALNAMLEVKEHQLATMMVRVNACEQRARNAERRAQDSEAALKLVQQEAIDLIAMYSAYASNETNAIDFQVTPSSNTNIYTLYHEIILPFCLDIPILLICTILYYTSARYATRHRTY